MINSILLLVLVFIIIPKNPLKTIIYLSLVLTHVICGGGEPPLLVQVSLWLAPSNAVGEELDMSGEGGGTRTVRVIV